MDFDACRFDFRLDSKNGLTPSKRKRGRRGNSCFNTLFKCKVCGMLFEQRAALLEHKILHNEHRCPICHVRVSRKATLKEHLTVVHLLGTGPMEDMEDLATKEKLLKHMELLSDLGDQPDTETRRSPDRLIPIQPAPPALPVSAPLPTPPAQQQQPGGMVCINVPIFIGNQGDGQQVPAMSVGGPTSTVIPTTPASYVSPSSMEGSSYGPAVSSDAGMPLAISEPVEKPAEALSPTVLGSMVPVPSKKARYDDDLEPGEIRRQPSNPSPPPAVVPPSSIIIGADGTPSIALTCNDGTVRMFSLQQVGPEGNTDVPPLLQVKTEPDELPFPHHTRSPENLLSDATLNLAKRKLSFGAGSLSEEAPDQMEEKRYQLLTPIYPGLEMLGEEDQVMDLSMKPAPSSEPSSTSSSVRPSPSITPSDNKGRKKAGLASMVAKLWQTKGVASSSREERATPDNVMLPQHKAIPMRAISPDDVIIVPSPEPPFNEAESHPITLKQQYVSTMLDQAQTTSSSSGKSKYKPFKFHTVKFHNCKVCHQLFDSAEKLWEHAHMSQCQDARVKCTACDFQGASTSAVVDHVLQVHSTVESVQDPLMPFLHGDAVQYMCTVCRKAFPSEETLEQHVIMHNNMDQTQPPPTLVTCNFEGCGFSCSDKFQLWHHIQKQHFSKFWKQKQIVCPEEGCGRRFVAQNHLKRHMVVHSDKRPLQCPEKGCGKRFKNIMNLRKHQTTHGPLTSTGLKCMLCEFTAAEPHVLSLHIKERHWNDDTDIAELDKLVIVDEGSECSNSAPSSPQVARSEAADSTVGSTEPGVPSMLSTTLTDPASHSTDLYLPPSVLQSPDVPLDSADSSMLAGYMTEGKYHTCDTCKELFENEQKLWSHRMIDHDEGSSLECEKCEFITADHLDLESHCVTQHAAEIPASKDYQCHWCGKQYTTRHGYAYHMYKHTDTNTAHHHCPADGCQERFDNKATLKTHMRRAHHKHKPACSMEGCCDSDDSNGKSQNGETRTLQCTFAGCDKSFRESKHLKVHMMLHTDEKPLKCTLCDYSCRQRNSLNWHMKSKHGKNKEVTSDGRTIYV